MIALQMTLEQNVCTKSNISWRNIGTRNTNTYLWFLSHQNLCCNSGSSSSCTFEIIVLIENVWSFELFWHLEHIKEMWRLMHFKSRAAARQNRNWSNTPFGRSDCAAATSHWFYVKSKSTYQKQMMDKRALSICDSHLSSTN